MTYDKRIILVAMLSCPLLPPACSRCDAASALEIYAAAESADDEADTEEEPQRSEPKETQVRSQSEVALRQAARRIAVEYGIPPRLYEAVIEFESGFKSGRGSSGEYGLAQVMPATGRMLEESGQVKSSWRYDSLENLRAGAAHLRNLRVSITRSEIEYAHRKQYNLWALLLAQYNGGKAGVGRSIRNNERLPYKLEWYIYNVLKRYNKL